MADELPQWMCDVVQGVFEWYEDVALQALNLKRCTKCKQAKHLEAFAQHKRYGRQFHCKGCNAAWRRDYYARTGQ